MVNEADEWRKVQTAFRELLSWPLITLLQVPSMVGDAAWQYHWLTQNSSAIG